MTVGGDIFLPVFVTDQQNESSNNVMEKWLYCITCLSGGQWKLLSSIPLNNMPKLTNKCHRNVEGVCLRELGAH